MDSDKTKAVVAKRVGSGQILTLYFKLLLTTEFTARMGESKKLGMNLKFWTQATGELPKWRQKTVGSKAQVRG